MTPLIFSTARRAARLVSHFLALSLACCAAARAESALTPAARASDVDIAPGYSRVYGGRGEVRGLISPPGGGGPARNRISGEQTLDGRGEVRGRVSFATRAVDPAASDKTVDIPFGGGGFVTAGESFSGDAVRNTLTMRGGTITSLIGGMTASGDAADNVVEVSGGHVDNEVRGGLATRGDALGNSVVIGSSVKVGNSGSTGFVFGGQTDDGNALGNRVRISGGVDQAVYGGYSSKGFAGQNSVAMEDGSTLTVTGGYCIQGDAHGNSVILSGGEVQMSVLGGRSDSGSASGNSVEIRGGVATAADGGVGATTADNRVVMSGGQVRGPLTGGSANTGPAEGNSIEISGGSVGSPAIPGSGAFGGVATNDTASMNTVAVSGGTVTGSVMGGSSPSGLAEKNSVILSGGTVTGIVAGGGTGSGSAVNNSVSLSGGPDLSGAAVYGGFAAGTAGDVHSGNTLYVREFRGSLKTVGNFENYDFFLPAGIADGSVILSLSESADISGGAASTKARITGMAEGRRLNPGDTVHLLQSAGALTADNMNLAGGSFRQGIAVTYDYALSTTPTSLDATILGDKQSPEVEGPADGSVAGAGLINNGADVIAGQGMDSALAAARAAYGLHETAEPWGVGLFGTVSNARLRYDLGSELNLNSLILVTGAVKLWRAPKFEILAGAFFDAGFGAYRSSRNPGGLSFSADGDSNYRGGGLLFRYSRSKGALRGAYAEASARAGSLDTSYESGDLAGLALRDVSYKTTTPYYGGHGGLGYVWRLGDENSLDLYGKFFWTHIDASTADIAGDPFKFQALDSRRLRGGVRFSRTVARRLSAYLGAAYERELDGKARASVRGASIPSTSFAGDTGIGELGVSLQAGKNGDFSVDLGVQGFVGKREGVAGNLRVQYTF